MSDSLMTPADIYAAVERKYGRPALDPCWHPMSPVRPLRAFMKPGTYPEGDWRHVDWAPCDGLAESWETGVESPPGWIWLNPPYSKPHPWLEKLAESGRDGVALLRHDHSTSWWDEWVCHPRVTRLGLFRHRLAYGRTDGGKQYKARFASSLVIYGHPGKGLPDLDVHWVYPMIPPPPGAPSGLITDSDAESQSQNGP